MQYSRHVLGGALRLADLPGIYYESRLDAKMASELVGLARGILADGIVSDSDVEALFAWLVANPEVQDHFPGRELSRRLLRIMDDGVVDERERVELTEYLTAMVGAGQPSVPGQRAQATTLPLDFPPPPITFSGSLFVFTGRCAFGTRDECAAFTQSLGGRWSRGLRGDADYLVIGLLGSEQWLTSAFGTKIVDAMAMRAEGGKIVICDEGHWLREARRSPGAVEAR